MSIDTPVGTLKDICQFGATLIILILIATEIREVMLYEQRHTLKGDIFLESYAVADD
jgi:hypothetical protein